MNPRTQTASLSLHLLAVAAGLLLPGLVFRPATPDPVVHAGRIVPQTLIWRPKAASRSSGGSGSERRPSTRGVTPSMPRPFLRPAPQRVERPQVILDSGVNVPVPRIDLPALGNPLAFAGLPPSAGSGRIGETGDHGSGRFRDGDGSKAGLGKVRGATPPEVIYKIEPEYADDARIARLQGSVLVAVDIDERGSVSRVRVLQPLGLGLDEKAVDAVQRWRFKPAMKDGKPIAYPAAIEVRFQLL